MHGQYPIPRVDIGVYRHTVESSIGVGVLSGLGGGGFDDERQ
jgi:hypothetical protein